MRSHRADGLKDEVLQFSECSPADGTSAAANKWDLGTSRWQLSEKATPTFRSSKGEYSTILFCSAGVSCCAGLRTLRQEKSREGG
jgi:hypothetical protein